jgi:hypothetical protein
MHSEWAGRIALTIPPAHAVELAYMEIGHCAVRLPLVSPGGRSSAGPVD